MAVLFIVFINITRTNWCFSWIADSDQTRLLCRIRLAAGRSGNMMGNGKHSHHSHTDQSMAQVALSAARTNDKTIALNAPVQRKMSPNSKAEQFFARLNNRSTTFERKVKMLGKMDDLPNPVEVRRHGDVGIKEIKATTGRDRDTSGKKRSHAHLRDESVKKIKTQQDQEEYADNKAEEFFAQLNRSRAAIKKTPGIKREDGQSVVLTASPPSNGRRPPATMSSSDVNKPVEASALSEANQLVESLAKSRRTKSKKSEMIAGIGTTNQEPYRDVKPSSRAFCHYEKNQVDLDVDSVAVTIRTEDLGDLFIQPVKLAGYTSTLAAERSDFYQSYRKEKNFMLITTTPVQLMVFGTQAELRKAKTTLWSALHRRDVMFIPSIHPTSLADTDTLCPVGKLREALVEAKAHLLRLYVFGQKENLRDCFARYDAAIERVLSWTNDNEPPAVAIDNSAFCNSFDFGKSFVTADSNVSEIPLFDIGGMVNQNLGTTRKRKTHTVFGGEFGEFGWVSGATTLADGQVVNYKIYPVFVHLLKATPSKWSVEPKDKRALVQRLSSLDRLFSNLVRLDPFRLCGYRVEVTIRGVCMADAADYAVRHDLISLNGICKLVKVRVRLVQVSKYLELFYSRMHNALQDQRITRGAGIVKLSDLEAAIYHGLLNQIGFNFGKQTKRHLRDDWKTCLCHLLTTHIHRPTKSSIKVDPGKNIMDAHSVLKYCIQKISSHPKSKQIVDVYRAIASKADLGIIGCMESNLGKCLVYYDIFRHADMFPRKGKLGPQYVFRDLRNKFLGVEARLGSCVEKIYREWGQANWRKHVSYCDGRPRKLINALDKFRESVKAERVEVMAELELEECDFDESDFGQKLGNIWTIEIDRKVANAKQSADATAREIKIRQSAEGKESTKASLTRRYPRDGYKTRAANLQRNRISSVPSVEKSAGPRTSARKERNQLQPSPFLAHQLDVQTTKRALFQGSRQPDPMGNTSSIPLGSNQPPAGRPDRPCRDDKTDEDCQEKATKSSIRNVKIALRDALQLAPRRQTGPWYVDVKSALAVEEVCCITRCSLVGFSQIYDTQVFLGSAIFAGKKTRSFDSVQDMMERLRGSDSARASWLNDEVTSNEVDIFL